MMQIQTTAWQSAVIYQRNCNK